MQAMQSVRTQPGPAIGGGLVVAVVVITIGSVALIAIPGTVAYLVALGAILSGMTWVLFRRSQRNHNNSNRNDTIKAADAFIGVLALAAALEYGCWIIIQTLRF